MKWSSRTSTGITKKEERELGTDSIGRGKVMAEKVE